MGEHLDVKAKLTLEDHSSEALEHIREGFDKVKEHASETMHELLGFGRDVAASFLGFQLGGAIESVREFGHEILGASGAEEEQIKGLAGVMSMSDRATTSLGDTHEAAAGMLEELKQMSIEAGASSDAVIRGFEEMAERGDHTQEELKGLTQNMIYAGKAVPGGFASITAGIEQMELGMARANNPVVTMIKQTGLMDGSAKQIAKTLTKMAQDGHLEKVMELGEKAVTKMADKMRDAQPTLEEVETSLAGMREQVFEKAGKPIVEALLPALEHLKDYLTENEMKIKGYATLVGEELGDAVTEGTELLKEGFEFVETHADEIKAAIHEASDDVKTAFHYAREVAEFVLAHKEAFAIAFGAKKALDVLPGVVAAGKGIAGGIGTAASVGKGVFGGAGAAEEGAEAAGGARAAAASATEFIGNLGKATIGANLAQATGASTAIGNAAAGLTGASAAAVTLGAALAALGGIAATGYEAFGLYNDLQEAGAQDTRAMADAAKRATVGYGEVEKATADANDWLYQLAAAGEDTKAALLETAMAAQDAANELNDVARMKAKEKAPGYDIGQEAMLLGPLIGKSMEKIGSLKNKDVHLNMSGSKFEIHQDFRDQDPDRVAVQFRDDLMKSATNRLQSGFSTPFGA